jgi:Domain of unknown function (DUF1883)
LSYLKFPIGQARTGAVVDVTLRGISSDVFLVDASNLMAMQSGRSYKYYGGHYKASPVRLGIPQGHCKMVARGRLSARVARQIGAR